jgi:hypothetical protein
MDLSAAPRLDPVTTALSPAAVADLLDTLDAADVRTTIAGLEDLLATVRRAVRVRARLAAVDADTLKAALRLRAQRRQTPSDERGLR